MENVILKKENGKVIKSTRQQNVSRRFYSAKNEYCFEKIIGKVSINGLTEQELKEKELTPRNIKAVRMTITKMFTVITNNKSLSTKVKRGLVKTSKIADFLFLLLL